MGLVINWKRSGALQGGKALAPTDTGASTGDPSALDAQGHERLELGELAVNYNASDPCIWLRKSDNSLAKFRPASGIAVVNRELDLPALASGALSDGDTFLVRYAADGTTAQNRLVVYDATLNAGAGGWNWGIEPATFVRNLLSDPAASSSSAAAQHLVRGDLQLTLEGGHQKLECFDGSKWVEIFSWDTLEQQHPSLKWAARYSDLPVPAPNQPIPDGASYMVRLDLGAQPLDRMFVWRELTKGTSGTGSSTSQGLLRPDSDVADPSYKRLQDLPSTAGSGPAIQAQLQALLWNYYIWDGADYAFKNSDIHGNGVELVGQTIHKGDKIGLVNTGPAAAPLYHWRIGAAFDAVASSIVGTAQTGEWHVVDPMVWVHGTASTTDNATDAQDGDLTVVTEKDHEQIKVYSNGAWIPIPATSTEQVKKWIASLSLFEGTTHEDGTPVVGAVGLSTLPDLTSTTPADVAAAMGRVGHYWIYVGADYTVPAAGTGGVANGISADLAGAVLRSGEWIMIANRGGDGVGTNPAPDLHYVSVPSDLLTYSRSVALYSHQNWTPGNWEQNSLVVYNGSLWRAASATVAADGAPTETGSVAQVELVDVPAGNNPTGTLFTITLNGTACSYTTVAANETQTAIRDGLLAAIRAQPQVVDRLKLETTPITGELRISAKQPGVPFTVAVTANLTRTQSAANVTASPWVKVPLSGGLRFVPTEADLPATALRQEIFYVLSHGGNGGKGALCYYDSGAAKWELLGGGASASKPLALTGGQLMLSIGTPVGSIMAWPFATAPSGWLLCDGSALSATTYPELTALLATNNQYTAGHVPDFRGCFLRGAGQHQNGTWGDPARVPGSWQNYKTALPTGSSRFKTDRPGNHQHSLEPFNRHGLANGGGNLDLEEGGTGGHVYTQGAGDHDHYITSGGDDETAPRNMAVNWIIKAIDDAVILRAAAATP